jgi:hypothetical protein
MVFDTLIYGIYSGSKLVKMGQKKYVQIDDVLMTTSSFSLLSNGSIVFGLNGSVVFS